MNLREARFQKKMSQWELSKRSNIHQSRISLTENGLYIPKSDEMKRLCAELRVNPEQIDWPKKEVNSI